MDSEFIGSLWAYEQLAGNVDTTPPSISLVSIGPAMLASGDPVSVAVDATDDTGVTQVLANGANLTHTSGNRWSGTVPSLPDLGTHQITITAYDAYSHTALQAGAIEPAGSLEPAPGTLEQCRRLQPRLTYSSSGDRQPSSTRAVSPSMMARGYP